MSRLTALRTASGTAAAGAVVVIASTLALSPAQAAPTAIALSATTTGIDTTSRSLVVRNYRTWLEPLMAVPTGWTGSLATCKAGTTSAQSRAATLSAVNYMRAMAGLSAVTLDATKSAKAQSAALIMAANGYLSHTPPRSAKCWTQRGYDGASHGNLYLAWGETGVSQATGPRAVIGYMVDPGASNTVSGHRRWLMYEQQKTIGTGDTNTSNSIYVVPDTWQSPRGTTWVPWPTAGYFPRELEPDGRWSLSYPGADFSAARIAVSTPTGPVAVTKRPVANGYGDNTLVWDMKLPAAYAKDPFADYRVSVTVSGIRLAGRTISRSWSTTLVKASAGVSVQTTSLPPAARGSFYSTEVKATGGLGGYTWRVMSGSLPPGTSLADGWISGTPTTAGTYSVVVVVTDGYDRSSRRTLSITVT